MTTKVLITGIAGFIGSHVVDRLSRRKFDIFGMDDLSSGKMENLEGNENKVHDVVLESIANPMAVMQTFDRFKPDLVIHLAAQPSLLKSIKNPDYDALVNVIGTINILRACEAYQVERLIFSSTSAITQDAVVSEEHSANLSAPSSPYGMSKRCAEGYIDLLWGYKPGATILRFANVYGPRQVPLGENQLIPRVIRHYLYGDSFQIYGDGLQSRDFIYVEDVADLIYKIATSNNPGRMTMNVATGKNTTVLGIVEMVQEVIGIDIPAIHVEPKDVRLHVKMNIGKADMFVGWKATTSIKDGIKKTVGWWKEQDGSKS